MIEWEEQGRDDQGRENEYRPRRLSLEAIECFLGPGHRTPSSYAVQATGH